jgi:chemotaxis protein CheX
MNAAELVPICITSTQQTLSMMAATETVLRGVQVVNNKKSWGDVTGFLGLTGSGCRGNLTISFSESALLEIVSKLLMDDFTELNDDVIDAVGELTNMISGTVKKTLLDAGFKIEMSSPVVLQGKGIPFSQGSGGEVQQILFETKAGDFVVQVSFITD